MAPEQLESGTGDARSDIFAFGAVLFEMATGRRAFEGNSQASVIAAIMRNDPPRASSFQPGSPGALDLLIANCLAKDPEQRWQNARDLRLQLQSIAQSIGQNDPAPPLRPVRSRRREAVAWLLAAALSALVVLLGIRQFRRTQQPSSTLSFTVPLPADAIDFPTTQTLAVSPDGRQLAIRAIAADGQAHIWLRPLGSIDSHLVPGTAGVENLSWSPDGRSLGFVLGNRLMKVSAEGGPPAAIADVMPDTADVTWSSRGDILFARYVDDVLYRLSERGGPFERYTTINSARHEVGHATPRFLPDGRRFLYSSRTQAGEGGVYLGSLQKPDGRLLIRGGWNGYYTAASGSSRAYIVYHRQMSLLAQAFDADREELSGEPFTVIGDPIVFPRDFSASQNGVLAYRAVPGEHLILGVDPDGRNQDTLSRPGDYRQIALSPDENTLALTRADTAAAGGGLSNIWLLDLSRHTFIRLTSSPTYDWCPVWSPDGKRIAFSSARSGRLDIYERAVSGAGTDALLLKSEFNKLVSSWSPDGRVLAYSESSGAMGNDIWILALEGDRKPFAFLQTQFNEFHPVFSPDGHWIAYTSDESGRPEIYVRKFEGTQASGRKWQISTNGGSHPKWRRDGKEIFYLSTDRKITAVALQTAPDLVAGAPKALFQTRLPATEYLWSYEPAAKGQRFLLNSPAGDVGSQAIKVIVGWNGAPAPAR
jgi:Tol biopolymer transport system component